MCVGNAMCETFAPHVFQLNANQQSEAVNPAGDTTAAETPVTRAVLFP